jgi:hypothetical protein
MEADILMKLELEYSIWDGQRAVISTENDIHGCRTLILPENLAVEIYNQLTIEWEM